MHRPCSVVLLPGCFECMYVRMYPVSFVCILVALTVDMYECKYVCTYVCMYACMRACNMYVDVRGFELLSVTGLERLNYSNSSHRNLKLDLLSTLSSISHESTCDEKMCVRRRWPSEAQRATDQNLKRLGGCGWAPSSACFFLVICGIMHTSQFQRP